MIGGNETFCYSSLCKMLKSPDGNNTQITCVTFCYADELILQYIITEEYNLCEGGYTFFRKKVTLVRKQYFYFLHPNFPNYGIITQINNFCSNVYDFIN